MNITPLQSHSVCVWEPWDTRGDSQTSDSRRSEDRIEVWRVETSGLFHYKETQCLQLPVMPNEFGVCMVYGRFCTGGRRRAPGMSLPSFLPCRVFSGVLSFSVCFSFRFFTFPEKVEGRKAVSFLNSGILFLHFLWPSWKYMECFLSQPRAFSCPSTI